jgi:hypothetical protein
MIYLGIQNRLKYLLRDLSYNELIKIAYLNENKKLDCEQTIKYKSVIFNKISL